MKKKKIEFIINNFYYRYMINVNYTFYKLYNLVYDWKKHEDVKNETIKHNNDEQQKTNNEEKIVINNDKEIINNIGADYKNFLFFEPFLYIKQQCFLKEYGTKWTYLCFQEAIQKHNYNVLYPFLPELRAYPFTLKEFNKLVNKIPFDNDKNALLLYTTKGIDNDSKKRKHSYSLKSWELDYIKKLHSILDLWQVSSLRDTLFKKI